MRTRWIHRATGVGAAVVLAACSDSTPPNRAVVDMLLDFCSDETPSFFAYQNEGGSWTRVNPDASGTFSFRATEKVALAIVHQVSSSASTEFIYATTDELAPQNGVACVEQAGTKNLSGSVAGVPAGSSAMISMAGAFDYLTAPTTAYALNGLPTGPLDLIAQRETSVGGVVPDRIIVRRVVNLVSGATIPVLDFGAAEAVTVATNTMTVSGLSQNDFNTIRQDFHTITTRNHSLLPATEFIGSTPTIYGVPASRLQNGDLHELNVSAQASGGSSYRGLTQYYLTPGNHTGTLGSALNSPTITSAQGAPYVRFRVQLASQAEYGTLATAYYAQQTSTAERVVVVSVTAGYASGATPPTTWDFAIPDLSSVSGFPTSAMLQTGAEVGWWVEAYGGTAGAFFNAPVDGASLTYAGRSSAVAATQYSAMRTRGSAVRPWSWSRAGRMARMR